MEHQDRAVADGEPVPRRIEMAPKDLLFAHPLVGEEAIRRLRAGPVLAGQRDALSEPGTFPTTTTRSRPGWHSIGVSTPSQRPARPRPRLSRFPLVHRVIHLHRPDHRVDAAPLECVRRRGLGPVDMTNCESPGAVEYAPVFAPGTRLQEFDERLPLVGQHQQRLREPAAGASWQATDIRGQADHMLAPHRCRSPRHGQFRLILGDSSRRSFLGNRMNAQKLLDAGLRRAGTM